MFRRQRVIWEGIAGSAVSWLAGSAPRATIHRQVEQRERKPAAQRAEQTNDPSF